jgi:hypothetical protein
MRKQITLHYIICPDIIRCKTIIFFILRYKSDKPLFTADNNKNPGLNRKQFFPTFTKILLKNELSTYHGGCVGKPSRD